MKEIAEQKLLLESSFNHQQTVYKKEIYLEKFLQTATNYLILTHGVTLIQLEKDAQAGGTTHQLKEK